ncbi:MAG: malate dehydrogenase [Coriobacteriales bacterium]|nr:malate dehydrogenase [Actinomycetes bacterium]
MPDVKVTVVGAGQVGATAAFVLALHKTADVVLVDIDESVAQGKALDMMHARSVERFGVTLIGSADYHATSGSDVVVITAGLPRKPGMTREDLLRVNGEIMRSVITQAAAASPEAVFMCVTNPLDVMTYLAWKVSGLDASHVLGMGGVLDSARFAYFISQATGTPVEEVDALVIGAHGDTMVPLPRLAKAGGRPLAELLSPERIEEVVQRTVFGGAEVVRLLKTGSAFYAPAVAVASMVRAVVDDARAAMPSCVLLTGQYGLSDLYLTVPAVLGRQGVVDVPEIDLTDQELHALHASAAGVREGIHALERGDRG